MRHDDGGSQRDTQWTLTRLGIAIFFTMNVMVFTLVLWSWNVHEISADPKIEVFRGILRYACLLFSAPVLILLGGPVLESVVDAFYRKQFTADALLLLGVVAAYGYSVSALLLDLPDVYFEVCCMILVAVTLGKWLEGTAKQRATKAIRSLRDLLPKTVRVVIDGGERSTDIEQVAVGQRVRVLPGERIPLDGSVDGAMCVLDEQFITGESLPVEKGRGDDVYAGSLNLSHELLLTVASPADRGTIARLVKAVEAATATACQSIRTADRLAGWFVPLIALAAVITFWWHYGRDSSYLAQHALMASVSVVLIACPCALGIATPMALWVAINSAAQRGVLFRSGDAVIQLAKLRSLGLDKTGTLTSGRLHVVSEQIAHQVDKAAVTAIACRLARSSNHPISKALFNALDAPPETSRHVKDIQVHPGRGVTGVAIAEGVESSVILGSLSFAREQGFALPAELKALESDQPQDHQAIVCMGWGQQIKVVYHLSDSTRRDTQQTLDHLKQLDLSLLILTGDTSTRADAMAQTTGVDAVGSLLPEQKAEVLKDLPAPVGMVGDGLNDAFALASVDVGIAMDCGADVTRESADVCLLGSTLRELPWAIELARATQKTIRRNLFWAVGYNAVGIGFAMTGNLNPIIAAIAMVGSSFFVLANSVALGFYGNSPSAQKGSISASPNVARESEETEIRVTDVSDAGVELVH